jgi:hypothetical protein
VAESDDADRLAADLPRTAPPTIGLQDHDPSRNDIAMSNRRWRQAGIIMIANSPVGQGPLVVCWRARVWPGNYYANLSPLVRSFVLVKRMLLTERGNIHWAGRITGYSWVGSTASRRRLEPGSVLG